MWRIYITKPKSKDIDVNIINGIMQTYKGNDFSFVDSVDDADLLVMHHGWTRSKECILDQAKALKKGIRCAEGYLYTDKYEVHLN